MQQTKQIAGLVLAGMIGLAGAGAASATEWSFCADKKQTVDVGLLLGQNDVPSVVAARLSHKDINYVTAPVYGDGKIIAMRQKTSKRTLSVDFFDEASKARIGELRLRAVKKGDESFYRGTLRLSGPGLKDGWKGSWAVACDVG